MPYQRHREKRGLACKSSPSPAATPVLNLDTIAIGALRMWIHEGVESVNATDPRTDVAQVATTYAIVLTSARLIPFVIINKEIDWVARALECTDTVTIRRILLLSGVSALSI